MSSQSTQVESTHRWHFTLHPSVELTPGTLTSAFNTFAHPTRARLSHSEGAEREWRSRSHRKHRYRSTGDPSSKGTLHKLSNMFKIEYWNISWWVAWSFTLGSIVWVINGFAGFLPLCDPQHFQTAHESPGWTAWLGATIFEVGSLLGILEAWNRSDVASFGWNVEQVLLSMHLGDVEKGEEGEEAGNNDGTATKAVEKPRKRWIWWSTDAKFWHEIGFLAAFFQLIAATVFWISGFTAIPTIATAIEDNTELVYGVFWTPQVIGGTGFIISATLIMLETQKKWYKPELTSLGWHIGFWNFVGAIGFTLCGALGYASANNSKAMYQSYLSTFWGGWAFLIGSVIQLYEAVNPV